MASFRMIPRLLSTLLLAVCLHLPAFAQDEVSKSEDKKPAKPEKTDEDYYELLKLFADTFDQIERNYVREVDRRKLFEAAIRGMMKELDQHSNYIPPTNLERFRTSVESEFGGVGIQVSLERGKLEVISPMYGSPAYKSGMRAGDWIMEIEGKSTNGITMDEAVRKIKGKVGTKVNLKVMHPGEKEPAMMAVERQIVRVHTVMGDVRNEDDSWKWLYDDDKKIGYLRVSGFGRHTTTELRDALEELKKQGMKALVLDLRFNPGGLLSAAIEVSDLFITSGKIVSTEGRSTRPRSWDARKRGTFEGFPMTILVNRYSASASEIVSACLQDHKRAVVVGTRTYGKGSVQNIIQLEDGRSAMKLTTSAYHRPSGKNIDRETAPSPEEWGVEPNEGFKLELSRDEINKLMKRRKTNEIVRPQKKDGDEPEEKFVDRQLEKALEYLNQQLNPEKKVDETKAKAAG